MATVITPGTNTRFTCTHCGALVEYASHDVHASPAPPAYDDYDESWSFSVVCPQCRTNNRVSPPAATQTLAVRRYREERG